MFRKRNASVDDRHKILKKDEPSFEEFIEYLLVTEISSYDEHWKPISLLCNVCYFQYDFYLKFENFGPEFNELVTYLKTTKQLPTNYQIYYLNSQSKINNSSSLDIAKSYMNRLPKSKVKILYEKYKQDFKFFDYSLNDFL